MILRRIDDSDLQKAGFTARTPYGRSDFLQLNAAKVDEVVHYGLYDGKDKLRMSLALGRSTDTAGHTRWRAPYSAPFAELLYSRPQTLETCVDFCRQLIEACVGTDSSSDMLVRLAPDCYDPVMLPRIKGAMAACCRSTYNDYNYHYQTGDHASFVAGLGSNARNHYNRACRAGFTCSSGVALERAYAVIERNRREHGYPLAMSLADLRHTAALLPIDTFVLSLGPVDVAAAIVYRISGQIAQVIYWGDVSGYSEMRPMNLLAAEVMGHYKSAGCGIVDIGPSSSDGKPDLGLCTFKESLGCRLTAKPTYHFISNGL